MEDITEGLSSLSSESGLTDDDKKLLHLRARSAGLTLCGCAHAAFACELVRSLSCIIKSRPANGGSADLHVGILGLGHVGKQLLVVLLEKTNIKPSQIKISTRRPEAAGDFLKEGLECFFDNRRLAAWADVLFLCCLPSQLPAVCPHLRSHLSKRCLVYSFASAVPVTRLANLFSHNFVIKPQYSFVPWDKTDVWRPYARLTAALTDPSLIEASCPLSMTGGIALDAKWLCAVMYSLLNVCTSASLASGEALSLINSVFRLNESNAAPLNAQSFVSPSSVSSDKPFPWISLTDAQTKETPLLSILSSCEPLQHSISAAYKAQLEAPVKLPKLYQSRK